MAQTYNILMNRFNGTDHDQLLPKNNISGSGEPTTSTVGIVGQIYMDISTDPATSYQCVKVDGGVYTWTKSKADSAVIRTYPVAAGQSITAGDVVDVGGGAVTKAGTPSQAIALQSGTAGQTIEVIYDGVAELMGLTTGTKITSDGVNGYCPLDGWIWVNPYWADNTKMASGSYKGTGVYGPENKNSLTFPFRPKIVFLAIQYYSSTSLNTRASINPILWDFIATPIGLSEDFSSRYANIFAFTDNTMQWYNTSSDGRQLNESNTTYHYVAIG